MCHKSIFDPAPSHDEREGLAAAVVSVGRGSGGSVTCSLHFSARGVEGRTMSFLREISPSTAKALEGISRPDFRVHLPHVM